MSMLLLSGGGSRSLRRDHQQDTHSSTPYFGSDNCRPPEWS